MIEHLVLKSPSTTDIEMPHIRTDEFKWLTNNFSTKSGLITSQTFTGLRTGRQWHLELLPNGVTNKFFVGSVTVFLVLDHEEPSRPSVHVSFKIHIVNAAKEATVSTGGEHIFNECDRYACRMVARETVMNPISGFLVDDRLTIVCQLALQTRTINVTFSSKQEQLMESGAFSDCALVCSDGILVPAWRNFLASQSAAFFAMFNDKSTKEATTGRVDIIDAPSVVIKELVRYTCCGKVERLIELADELFPVSDKYGIDELKDICSIELRASLSKENVCHRVALARLHNCGDLESAAFKFFKENARDIMQFKDSNALFLRYPDLALEICAFLGKQVNGSN